MKALVDISTALDIRNQKKGEKNGIRKDPSNMMREGCEVFFATASEDQIGS